MGLERERRQFIRLDVRALIFVKDPKTGKVKRTLTKNISAGGVLVVTSQLHKPGEQLEIEVQLPDFKKPVTFLGEVVWSTPIGGPKKRYEDPTAETGIRIIQIDPSTRTLILQYVQVNAPPPPPDRP